MRIQDGCRGKLPLITTERDTITFTLKVELDSHVESELVLRCEREGEIYASLNLRKAP